MSTHPARCRFCGRPTDWLAHDRTGKAAPIDVDPDPAGTVLRVAPGVYHVVRREEDGAPWVMGEPRFTNHFQTCERRDAAREGFPP